MNDEVLEHRRYDTNEHPGNRALGLPKLGTERQADRWARQKSTGFSPKGNMDPGTRRTLFSSLAMGASEF